MDNLNNNARRYHYKKGEENIRFNAFKHGLNCKKQVIMPCRKNCMFKDVCRIYPMLYSDDEEHEENMLCALELGYVIILKDKLDQDEYFKGVDKKLVDEFISYSILSERSRRCLALHPDYLEKYSEGSKYYEYLIRYENKTRKVVKKIMSSYVENIYRKEI